MAQNKQPEVQQEQVATTVSGVEDFFKKNQKWIEWALIALVVIIFGIFAYNRWVVTPARQEAQEQMYQAEQNFRNKDFETALNGDGNVLGFKDILDEYGTKGGKDVYLYAGICELRLGNFQEAINYLKKYKGKEHILSARALACIGDAYTGLEDYKTAVGYFEKAADLSDNAFSAEYLLKAGVAYEELGDNDKALACYKRISDNWPNSVEGYDIDKYISRIESK